MSDYKTFVVPYDFSEHASAALFAAADLAKRLGANLHLIYVIQTPSYAYGVGVFPAAGTQPPIGMAEVRLGAMESLCAVAGGIANMPGAVEAQVLEGGSISDVICESAEQLNADLIVMGTHGRTGMAHVFIGSVAERTLRSAPCPVLTIRSENGAGSEE